MSAKKTIDEKTVEHVAKLARLGLSKEELILYKKQLASILAYIEKLDTVDTSKAIPTSHPLESLKNVFREDIARPSLSSDEALKNAPKREDDFYGVPKIIE